MPYHEGRSKEVKSRAFITSSTTTFLSVAGVCSYETQYDCSQFQGHGLENWRTGPLDKGDAGKHVCKCDVASSVAT
jgi:hypothetical protein